MLTQRYSNENTNCFLSRYTAVISIMRVCTTYPYCPLLSLTDSINNNRNVLYPSMKNHLGRLAEKATPPSC